MSLEYESDDTSRTVEQMGTLLRRATTRLREGVDDAEPFELSARAIGLGVDMDPHQFVGLAPQSMVSLLEIAGSDCRVVSGVADALEIQAELLDGRGALVEASVRREQAAALRASLDRGRAN